MTITKEQYIASQQILHNNPSMRWDGVFGSYSNGQVVMNIYWDFDKTIEKYKITLNADGSQS